MRRRVAFFSGPGGARGSQDTKGNLDQAAIDLVQATDELDCRFGYPAHRWPAPAREPVFGVVLIVENGVRKPFQHASPSLETEPGRLSVTLTANYRGEQASQRPPRVAVTVPLQSPNSTRSFIELAARVRRDAIEIRNSAGAVIGLLGGLQGNQVQYLDLDHVTDEAILGEMTSQIRWLRDYDEVKPFDANVPSGPPTGN